MKDLIRSYKLAIRRKNSLTDSDNESQPLVASASSSITSFGTQQNDMRFIDSDSTDLETDSNTTNQIKQAIKNYNQPLTKQIPAKNYLRNGLIFPPSNDFQILTVDIYTHSENIYERYDYFTKVNGGLIEDSLLGKKTYDSYEEFSNSSVSFESTQNSVVTIFAVWNTTMGSSLLAMAWGLEKAGLVPGIFLILAVGAICLYTTYVILKINEKHGVYKNCEVHNLCRILLGKWAEVVAKIFSLIVLIGANIVYWILMSNFLYYSVHFLYTNLFSYDDTLYNNQTVVCPKQEKNYSIPGGSMANIAMGHQIFDNIWSLYSTVPLFLAVIMFPLLNFKSATFFTKFNSLGTISVAYLLIFVAVKGGIWGINIPDWTMEFELKNTFCALSGMLSLSFFIHNIIISIMKNNRHQENNGRDLSIAYGLVTFTYLFIGVVFYMTFPLVKSCIEDNILNNFPKSDAMTIIARVLLLFQLFTVFPLMAFMLRNDIIMNLAAILKWDCFAHFSYFRVIILNGIVVTVCILFACFLPRIGTLIRYTGALSGMVYIFTLPSLLKIASLRRDCSLTTPKLIFFISIIVLGAINLFSQFLINDS